MAKTPDQIYAERRQKIKERRKFLIENPEKYQRDFDEAFKNYLMRKYPEGLDPEDCDNKFHPLFREDFPDSPEGLGLAIKYSLNQAWDLDGDDPPSLSNLSSTRLIWCQNNRIKSNEIRAGSVFTPYKPLGRFLILEIDLSYPQREIYVDIMAWVAQHRKKIKVSGPHRKLVKRPEPRNRDSSYTYKPMEVWQMVEEKRGTSNKPESKILSQLAKELCELEGWDKTYGKFEDDPDTEERVKARRKALKAAFKRDWRLYNGGYFIGISE